MKKLLGLMLVLLMSNAVVGFSEEAVAPATDPAMEAMMAKMTEYGTPAEGHARLEPLIGKWNHSIVSKMDSKSPEQTMTGTNENKWILGGRFIQQETKGEWMGKPFEGIGITGYDNFKKEYSSVWLDNMGTGMMISTGTFDEATGAINESGKFTCPIKQGEMEVRSVWKIVDNDHYTYEMYTKDEAGAEFKMMEITYERAV